jgi:dihydrofolate reductase
MRKIRLYINVTLDGYVAGPNGELDWVFRTMNAAQQAWTTAFLREVDTILIGHATYLEQAAFWPTQTGEMATLMNSHTKIVFSSRLPTLEWNHSRLAVSDVAEEIAHLKREPGRDIYVTGGARLSQSLSQRGLIDEYNLTIHPVILGSGMPLFQEMSEPLALILVRTTSFETGAVQLIYQRASAQEEMRQARQNVQ